MTKHASRWLILVALATPLVACGGGSDPGATGTSAPTTTEAVESTVPATDVATTLPATTLPPTLNLADLPGLLAVEATSCGVEPVPMMYEIPDSVICTMRPDGTGAQWVSLPGEDPSSPVLLRDGRHMLYQAFRSRYGMLLDLTTGERRERVANEPLRLGTSPDGKWILFYDAEADGLAVATVDMVPMADGLKWRVVVPDYYATGGSWAPDSNRFAYLSTADGAGGELECPEVWVGSIDGAAPTQITDFASGPDGAVGCPETARWSPTTDTILIRMLGKPAFVAENLYTIKADGTDLTALTHAEPDFDPEASTYAVAGASYAGDWSPDGAYIAFIMGNGEGYDLYVMNADGSQVTKIADAPLGITTSLIMLRWALG
ncbi:MAG: hypothetical protein Q7V57_13650 [Actinomycetota bacterium]|nr:hypothetical protein [Actinomycetota bacterium]